MKESIEPQVLYWAIAILIALAGAAWKAAGMRGSINETWADRVDVLKTGLAQGAVRELKILRERIDELLGAKDDVYESITAEPANLLQSVKRFEKLIRVRRTISNQFGWLMRLGNIMVPALLAMIVGVVLLGLYFSHSIQVSYQLFVGATLLCGGSLVGLGCFLTYWILQNKLSGAEILARAAAND